MNNSNTNSICTIIDLISTDRSEALATFNKFMTSCDDVITMQNQYNYTYKYSTSPKLHFDVLLFMIGLGSK